MGNLNQLLDSIASKVRGISPRECQQRLQNNSHILFLDIREREDHVEGYISGAKNVPRGFLELRIEGIENNRTRPILIYGTNSQGPLAAYALKEMGYTDVFYMEGGFEAWIQQGFPTKKDRSLNKAEVQRFSRHLLIPEVGERGQGKLLDAKVLLIGAGGLGSPSSLYLAAAGIGTIGIVDADVVDVTNLQRQIIHGTSDLGRPKAISAYETLKEINPGCEVIPYTDYLTSENIMDILPNFDIVVNGSDNFPTRYLVNDACVISRKPIVDASIFRFEGQITIFPCDSHGPCYRCLYPAPPPADLAPS